MAHMSLLPSLLLVLLCVQGIHALDFIVINNATKTKGGDRFNREIGAAYAKQKMVQATEFVWKMFRQEDPATRRDPGGDIHLVIQHLGKKLAALTYGNYIYYSQEYLRDCKVVPYRLEFAGILQHESTHLWQWLGNNKAPGGLIEGIADWMRLKSGLWIDWPEPGEGDKWDEGYGFTARFLDYCNDLKDGFVAELNKKMKDDYSDHYFVELLGKSVDQLWKEYKAKYGHNIGTHT